MKNTSLGVLIPGLTTPSFPLYNLQPQVNNRKPVLILYEKTLLINLFTDNKLQGTFSNIHLYGEYSALNWLRIIAGTAYLIKADAHITMTPNESITQDGITLEPDEIGVLTTEVTYKKFAPYIGLGFGKGFPQHRFNVNLYLGLYYLSAPKVTMTGTEYLSDNAANGSILTENMKNYRFLPVIQLNFNFKLSK